MKIVHSFWSKPFYKQGALNKTDRSSGGWLERKFNYFSWALSCLKFKEFYDKVELYTDEKGYDLLVKQLGLPYTKVYVVLDELNHYHTDLWALGKLQTYRLQEEPFLHVDGDIFVWEKFDDQLLQADLICQNFEDSFAYYRNMYMSLKENGFEIPNILNNYFKATDDFSGINAGIIGGQNISFFKDYVNLSFDMINNNLAKLSTINIGLFNNFFEQCLFKTLIEVKKIDIECLLNEVNETFDYLVDFTGAPVSTQYIHTVGAYKKREETGRFLAFTLLEEYPEYYFRIVDLLKYNKI